MRHGLTLIETLAVTALLGMVAALGVPALVRSIAQDPLDAVVTGLMSQEAQARALAYGRGGHVELRGNGLGMLGPHGDLVTYVAPSDVQLDWTISGSSAVRLDYDTAGRSRDVAVTATREQHYIRLQLAGLTGEWLVPAGTP